jgi:predicted DNA-binding protein (UPF0251 family)
VPGRKLEKIEIGLDEFEAIRLADLEGLYHDEAAKDMGVSRATFGRMIEAARHKVANALVNGKMLVVTGGVVRMATKRVFECRDCGHRFEVPYGTGRPTNCPSCRSSNFGRAADELGAGGAAGRAGQGRCRRMRCRHRGGSAGITRGANGARGRARDEEQTP